MSTSDELVTSNSLYPASAQESKGLSTVDSSPPSVPTEADSNDLHDDDNLSCGSLDLGKHRQEDAPQTTDPEKHVTQRAPSKEFHFPKSN